MKIDGNNFVDNSSNHLPIKQDDQFDLDFKHQLSINPQYTNQNSNVWICITIVDCKTGDCKKK